MPLISVSEDHSLPTSRQDLCMSEAQTPNPVEPCLSGSLKAWNSEGRSFKQPKTVNDYPQNPKGFSVCQVRTSLRDQKVSTAATSGKHQASKMPFPKVSSLPKIPDGPEEPFRLQQSTRFGGTQPSGPVLPSSRSLRELHQGGAGECAPGPVGGNSNPFRKGYEGSHLSGCNSERDGLGQLDVGPHELQHQDGACGLPHVCSPLRGGGRGNRSHAASDRGLFRNPRGFREGNRQELQPAASRGRCVGRDLQSRDRRKRSPRAGDCPGGTPRTDGASDATADSACQPDLAVDLGEIKDCQEELEVLVAQNRHLSEIETKAQHLLSEQASLPRLKSFLKSVPWQLLMSPNPALRECVSSGLAPTKDDMKSSAYVMFGMFMHGGVTGVTKVTKSYPYLTRVLNRIVHLTAPEHEFTSVGISVNSMAQPHKDKFNSREHPNLVVPFEYPISGGEIWVDKPPHARQSTAERMCGHELKSGSLQVLKPGIILDPHTWHASQPWEGNRALLVAYSLKPVAKLSNEDRGWLSMIGFRLPKSESLNTVESPMSDMVPDKTARPMVATSPLRHELEMAQHLLQPSSILQTAATAVDACSDAFIRAKKTAWDAFQDSQLAYQCPVREQLDVLEIYSASDSRLSEAVRTLGGKAQRFTLGDGDLRTIEGQRKLWDVLQETQPKHVWLSPSCRAWCSWNNLNASRSDQAAARVRQMRQDDEVHLQLCAKIFQWQMSQGRHFHLEQPAQSKMLDQLAFKPIREGTQQVIVDLSAFGLRTPVSRAAIRKRMCLVSSCPEVIQSLTQTQCPGHLPHSQSVDRAQQLHGATAAHSAGTYCRGFSQHVAQAILQHVHASALAADPIMPLTRKRQKTSLSGAVSSSRFGAHKRSQEVSSEGAIRSQAQPRLSHDNTPKLERTLPENVWKPVFELVPKFANKVAPSLVSPQSSIIEMIQEALPEYKVMQVFAGCGSKQLHWPLGALPTTVAPWRISIYQRTKPSGQVEYVGLEPELRGSVDSKQRRGRIGNTDYLVTILAQKKLRTSSTDSHTPLPSPADPPTPGVNAEPNLEGWAPPPTPIHGPAFRNLDKESKMLLIRVHKNLGHPAPTVLSQHLRAAGYDKALVDGALEYQCDTCLESTAPRHQRPSKLPEPREFNELIGVDGFYFKSQSGYRAYVVHVLDEASCFHQGRRTQSRHSTEAMQTLSDCWFAWAGNPRRIYLDPAGEFRSDQILEQFQGLNTQTYMTAAAWQRGRLERHGDVAKEMLSRLDKEVPIINDSAFDKALTQVFQAKNALVRHLGYSPEQIVLGKSIQVPGSLTSDEGLAAHTLALGDELEAEQHRQRLELRCAARKAFLEADNSQAIRRAVLRRSTPARGPYSAGSWVLYWTKKSSPNRLAAGRWHGPAKVICQEGQSIVWVAHGPTILRRAPENLRPASLREWQQLTTSDLEGDSNRVGGASSYLDLTSTEPERAPSTEPVPPPASVDFPTPANAPADVPVARGSSNQEPDISQPEQELTPQVSTQSPDSLDVSGAPEVERGPAAPSVTTSLTGQGTPMPSEVPAPSSVDASSVPIPESDDGLSVEQVLLTSEIITEADSNGPELLSFTALETSAFAEGPPLAEDNLPFIEEPLECLGEQAFCLEIPMKPKDLCQWSQESSPEQLATVAAAGKRARAEVRVKDLNQAELALFDQAKQKELQCWIQTSAIKPILRRKLNPAQILRSRWILTWKDPEPGESQKRAKARLVVLGFQDPKLVEVMRDAPTLSREGRSVVLQTIASCGFPLSSFDIKTAFLRGKADEANPLAMEPPAELRELLKMPDSEVCQLVGNAYGRVDAPLLFYKELCKQLKCLGFSPHPLEPCVFLLKTGARLRGILGVHVDDGVCGGDEYFLEKVDQLQKILPFGSRKHQAFIFTGIKLEQFPDFSIRASQAEYVHKIPQKDIGRPRRQVPDSEVNESERTKLRGLIGSLQYAVTHTRPDMAARLGELQCQTSKATVQTLLQANKALREAQEHHQVCIYFRAIPTEQLTFVAFGDASFASSKNLNSHQGVLICATNDRLNQNLEAPVSPMTWSSKKIPRVVRSTLSAEAYAMSKAVDLLGWVRALWGVIHVPNFQWQQPETGFKQLRTAIIVTDCKSLYDLVTRLAMPSCEEYRTTLEVLLIKQRCQENTCFRWVPTTLQAADCLTKAMDSSLLRAVLARGQFKLYDPNLSLEKDAQRKQAIQWLHSPPTS